jgi:hypothetical protein
VNSTQYSTPDAKKKGPPAHHTRPSGRAMVVAARRVVPHSNSNAKHDWQVCLVLALTQQEWQVGQVFDHFV